MGHNLKTGFPLDLAGQAFERTLADVDLAGAAQADQLVAVRRVGLFIAGDAVRVDEAADRVLQDELFKVAVDRGQRQGRQGLAGARQDLVGRQRPGSRTDCLQYDRFLSGLTLAILTHLSLPPFVWSCFIIGQLQSFDKKQRDYYTIIASDYH